MTLADALRWICAAAVTATFACAAGEQRPDAGAGADADLPDAMGDESPGDGEAEADAPLPDTDAAPRTLDDLLGIYAITGSEPTYGAYTGEAELRAGETLGTYRVIHTRRWTDARFEGLRMAQAWQGRVEPPFALHATLATRNFMRSYGGLTRSADAAPAVLTGNLAPAEDGSISVTFAVGGGDAHEERWIFSRASADAPLWRDERRLVPSHDPLDTTTRDALFDNYADYHGLADVAPYTERPEFRAAAHGFFIDPTDHAFLRAHPDTVRVIQGVVDTVSLAEARLRHRGYAHSLAAKAAEFDARAPTYHLSSAGFFADWQGPDASGYHDHSGDGLLWSGMYLASQALRYFETGSAEALEHVRRVLDAMFACYGATGDPAQFCRTMRAHVDDGSTSWRRGVAPYEHLDWMVGGNNDMAHGLEIGFIYGWLALEAAGGDAGRTQRMREISESLLTHSAVVGDGAGNELRWTLLVYALTDDFGRKLAYETRFAILEPFLIDEANGVRYDDHLSMDASGNHLNLLGLLGPYLVAQAIGHDHADTYREGMRNYFEVVRRVRVGLHQLVSGAVGYDTPPLEVEDALWRLREYPIRKQDFDIDHRIDPSWCVSPWPKLPWKNDWATTDRTQGLYGYPLFERNPDASYQWKSDPMWYRGGASQQVGGNADFLFAYWFGRHVGVITPDM